MQKSLERCVKDALESCISEVGYNNAFKYFITDQTFINLSNLHYILIKGNILAN